ncbi:cyclin-dependent kinase 12 [Papilio machaon]|uniref:cyclin-dependent kinase 12 n=1 Tax=Papilio machaon TaxID=76193 RepID=UPI001E6644D0|nr:cyclin-dependent kinase 12 [Papilio machaon]
MECQKSDSKKLFKVFDASKRKRKKKKRDGPDDSRSLATDDSANQASKQNGRRVCSAKASLQNTSVGPTDVTGNTNRDSSPTMSQVDLHRASRSPRHHRRTAREGISLALKAGLVSTPRSMSPSREEEGALESVPQDQDSFIYQFLEEAIKKDKKKQRHLRKHEERKASREREAAEHRHHHRRHREDSAPTRDRDNTNISRPKEQPPAPIIDQTVLLETFAKLCAQINRKPSRYNTVSRTISNKSLQCEVAPRGEVYEGSGSPARRPARAPAPAPASPSRIRSHDNFGSLVRLRDTYSPVDERRHNADKCVCCYSQSRKYNCESKLDMLKSRPHLAENAYYEYGPNVTPPGSCIDAGYGGRQREYKDYDRREQTRDRYGDDRRRYCEKKASRSFEIQRECGDEPRGTARSDPHKVKRGELQRNRRYGDRNRDRYYEDKAEVRERIYDLSNKEKSRRHLEQFDRQSVASRDVDERYSEKERDSGLSGADGETSTASGRSNYMRVVKQEIAEQREAMDKMMKLWKELMRCFKGMSQTQDNDKNVQEAENVRESAAAQLRLWRECMRRYETVSRDVGDTDARLMEEINKQRSEMAEMAGMWQECLQRYRDMSNDFNSLKKQLASPDSPQRAPPPPPLCAEVEPPTPVSYRLPPAAYPPIPCPMSAATMCVPELRGRPPVPPAPGPPQPAPPPAWWWAESPARRRSSPDSRASRDRRHRRKERDDSRYKEKPSKTNATRSEHRHRKR